jgi:uncharacterized protein involved in exopolysaccharide biosynthesis
MLDWLIHVARRRWLLLGVALLGGAVGYGISWLLPPVYTARASILPPQQQSVAANALAALGGLSALAGQGLGVKTPADQYLSLMQSFRVADRIIDAFDLVKVYDARSRQDARMELERRTRLGTERKDTLITIEVEDSDPVRAAAVANRYVEELRLVASQLALTEAQQRRVFFEKELQTTKQRLAEAQKALQASGYNPGALQAEPRAAAETYGRLKAEMTQAEVQLQALRRNFADGVPEVQRQMAIVEAMRSQLSRLEAPRPVSGSADYIGRLREYKYQEALFEIFARQYETARLDESREGTLVQVVDAATPPELRSRPKRKLIAIGSAVGAVLAVLIGLTAQLAWRRAMDDPRLAPKLRALQPARRRATGAVSSP